MHRLRAVTLMHVSNVLEVLPMPRLFHHVPQTTSASARLGRAALSPRYETRGRRSRIFSPHTSSERVFPVARPAVSFRALRQYSSAFAPSDRAAHVGRRGGDVGARPQQ